MPGLKSPGGLIIPLLLVDDLRTFVSEMPSEIKNDANRRRTTIFYQVLQRLVGKKWVEKNILATALGTRNPKNPAGHLELEFSDDVIRETKSMRLFEIAETLMNLQLVPGIDACIDRLRSGDAEQIESTFAELQIGKFIYLHDWLFCFMPQDGKTGLGNYDFEIAFSKNLIVYAEAKCKLEAHDVSAKTVFNSLRKALKQLPKGKPGIIIVKVPQHWFEDKTMVKQLRETTLRFFRNTSRVVSVKFYVAHITVEKDTQMIRLRHAKDEIDNPNPDPEFPRRGWGLFDDRNIPKTEGMPPKWISLMDIE